MIDTVIALQFANILDTDKRQGESFDRFLKRYLQLRVLFSTNLLYMCELVLEPALQLFRSALMFPKRDNPFKYSS